MSHTCSTCGREVGESAYCPYCSPRTDEREQSAIESAEPNRTQLSIVRSAIMASAASIVLPALAFGHRVLTDVPSSHSPIRVAYALAALVGGLMACVGLVLAITALARGHAARPAPVGGLASAILCCLAALPVNAALLLGSQWVQ